MVIPGSQDQAPDFKDPSVAAPATLPADTSSAQHNAQAPKIGRIFPPDRSFPTEGFKLSDRWVHLPQFATCALSFDSGLLWEVTKSIFMSIKWHQPVNFTLPNQWTFHYRKSQTSSNTLSCVCVWNVNREHSIPKFNVPCLTAWSTKLLTNKILHTRKKTNLRVTVQKLKLGKHPRRWLEINFVKACGIHTRFRKRLRCPHILKFAGTTDLQGKYTKRHRL